MKRTTLALDDDLLQELRLRSAREGRSMQALVNDLIRHSMARDEKPGGYRLSLKGWEAHTRPGVDILDRDALCREHGVGEIVTGDRGLSRFSGLAVTNPFGAEDRP